MQTGPNQNGQAGPPTGAARFRWRGLLLWLPACLISAALAAKAAVVAQSYFAPLGFFPLLVGVALGAILVAFMRLAQVAHRPTVLAGTVLAALLAAAGQHYLCYRTALTHIQQKLDEHPEARLAFADALDDRVPDDFADYLRSQAAAGRDHFGRGLTVWLSWALDAVLLLAATLAVVVTSMRMPYCDRCRSWYRTTRAGDLDVAIASRVAELAGIRLPRRIRSARFRLQACTGGCGPTALELFWVQTRGARSSQRVWLDTDQRNRISRVLDEQIHTADQTGP